MVGFGFASTHPTNLNLQVTGSAVALVAGKVGNVRLIDNRVIDADG